MLHPLSDAEAEERSAKRELYTAVIEENGRPKWAVQISASTVRVYFLDFFLRKELSYVFSEVESSRLFLEQAFYFHFDAEVCEPKKTEIYVFETDGTIFFYDRDSEGRESPVMESQGDVTSNWDQFPEFGKYEHLLRRER